MVTTLTLASTQQEGLRDKARITKKDLLVWTRHVKQIRPRQCDICPETIDLLFQNKVQRPWKERIIPATTTPLVTKTSPQEPGSHTSISQLSSYWTHKVASAPNNLSPPSSTRLNIDPSRKTHDR
uniref:Uncharacterized protein n=1 Tax=Heterorhabditis bacteriophora TaxID=37862 RepID=A0A1I7WR96_HETBA